MHIIYQFCFEENNEIYTEIEGAGNKIKIKIIDYIELIKKDKFYGGYMELYALSQIYKKYILVFKPNDIDTYSYLSSYEGINKEKYQDNDIIFLEWENGNHYNLLFIKKDKSPIIEKVEKNKPVLRVTNTENNYSRGNIDNNNNNSKILNIKNMNSVTKTNLNQNIFYLINY